MIDHLTLTVHEYEKSVTFYTAILNVLGYTVQYVDPAGATGFGKGRAEFWVAKSDDIHPISTRCHIAFQAPSKEAVDTWHALAIASGAIDNGNPGPRPKYHDAYYAAFVIDVDGNNIEAVFGNSEFAKT